MVTYWLKTLLKYVGLTAILAVMLFPLVWMIRVAFLPSSSGSVTLTSLFASSFTFENFTYLFVTGSIGRDLFNSAFVAIVVTAGNILFCFMVAYVLARQPNVWTKLLFGSVLVVLMIPAHILIVPLYSLMTSDMMPIHDTYYALILPWLVYPIGIFLVKQYIESLPTSMEEAARIDGASELRIICQVVMPLCKPVLAVLAIQVFFTNWNSLLFPLILTSSEHLRTLPVGLSHYGSDEWAPLQHKMAGATIAVIPVLILFIILQRRIVSGITAGAVKQ